MRFTIDELGTLVSTSGLSGDVVIPAEVVKIGGKCMLNDKSNIIRISFAINSMCTELNESGFYDLPKLKVADLRDGKLIKSISKSCFHQCTSLERCLLPDDGVIDSIQSQAFWNCASLSFINFPMSITVIGDWLINGAAPFTGCNNLKSIQISPCSRLKKIGVHSFHQCGLTSFVVPRSVSNYDVSPFVYSNFLSYFDFEEGNPNFFIADEMIFSPDKLIWISTFPTKKGNITIPPEVTSIQSEAMRGCIHITGIKITDRITIIPTYFAESCPSLMYVELPNSVNNIAAYAFSNDPALTFVKIDGNPSITSNPFSASKTNCGFLINDQFYNTLITAGSTVGRNPCIPTIHPRTPKPSRCYTPKHPIYRIFTPKSILISMLIFSC